MSNPPRNPSSRVDFGHIAEDYETTRYIPEAFMKELIDDIIHTCDLKPENLVLELGCGAGRFLRALATRKIPVVGIDVSQGMLRKAYSNQLSTKFLRSNLALGDAVAIPLNHGIFQTILAIHLFHLISDWQEALTETIHVLASEGTIITGYVESITSQSFLNLLYRERREELGYSSSTFGVGPNEVVVELKSRDAAVETHYYQTTIEVPLHLTISYLERRVFSSMWRNLPDVIHRQIMQEVRAAATTQFKDINDIEPIQIDAQLHFITFK